jgi:uncharacterized membrane protein YeaQ/YmgE (transglycosylase-associated protein family)
VEEIRWFAVLVVAGASVGLVARLILGDKAYGVVIDALLGITGAFAANWAIGRNEVTWSWRATLTIWAAAFLPWIAHFRARRNSRSASREMEHREFPK